MKIVICKHRKYRGGEVLESTAEVSSLDAALAVVTQSVLRANAKVVESIQRGVIGHHFIDDESYMYQIVIK